MLNWQWSRFEDLTAQQLYTILQLRQEVFVVEQDCAYQDVDGIDQHSWHLAAWRNEGEEPALLAYLRVVDPGQKYTEPSIGRVLTAQPARGTGLGRELMSRALILCDEQFDGGAIRISAQLYLADFYSEFAFERVSEPYDEDGIPHIEMLRPGRP
ncbi:GNAT family N-acetyltransferase [Microbulbifer flavimaris]|uniref:GNAT family N-acetyltransferase n=1 Tax=Microbulbifer flavimaris TaxID=1781068 RepID=A0ABX4I2Y6_9GAMM|nr:MULTISPECIES: GNAT family N-acetyltransferase [Microbulbifer]KUJ84387.1 acetyltransferase [Microbulbifer sp. ZGT114]PCO06471.1 GNAT family N-acetyltransferase [Microbulbifer flavimaris]